MWKCSSTCLRIGLLPGGVEELLVATLAPLPRVSEGGVLRLILIPLRLLEEDVVVPHGVEGWVEVDQVDRFIRQVLRKILRLSP